MATLNLRKNYVYVVFHKNDISTCTNNVKKKRDLNNLEYQEQQITKICLTISAGGKRCPILDSFSVQASQGVKSK